MDSHIRIPHCVTHSLTMIKHPAQIPSASIAGFVRVVHWRRDADAGCGLAVKIAHVVRKSFKFTHRVIGRLLEYFVHENKVVSGAWRPSDRCVGLEIKVPVAILGDTRINELSGCQLLLALRKVECIYRAMLWSARYPRFHCAVFID